MPNFSEIHNNVVKPPIIIGTEVYSGNWGVNYTAKDIETILKHAFLNGVTEIDTASSYGDNHFVEKLIGDSLSGLRNDFVIATKFHVNQSGTNKGKPITTVSDIEKDLSDSLASLKTNYLDIYYFHSGSDEIFFQDHIWAFLNDMVQQGVIKKLGLSLNHGLVKSGSNRQILSAKNYGISVIQTVLNIISDEALEFVIPYCKQEGLQVYGRMPLAKGLLSGKYTKSSVFAENDPRKKDPEMTKHILDLLQNQEKQVNINYAIEWALENADKIVIGTKNKEQLDQIIQICVNG